MQEGMLFMPCTVSGARSSFNQLSCRITGSLDTALFHAAWQQLIDRHPVMRTSFHWENSDKPMRRAGCTTTGATCRNTSSFNQLRLPDHRQPRHALFHAAWRQLIDRHPVMRTSFHWEEFDKPMQVVHAHATTGATCRNEQRTRWQAHLKQLADDRRSCAVAWRASPPTRTCSAGATTTCADGWCLSLVIDEIFQVYGALARARRAPGAPLPRTSSGCSSTSRKPRSNTGRAISKGSARRPAAHGRTRS